MLYLQRMKFGLMNEMFTITGETEKGLGHVGHSGHLGHPGHLGQAKRCNYLIISGLAVPAVFDV